MDSYAEALAWLYSINKHGGVKLGLDNVRALDALLGHPHRAYKVVHVAGTNGKGSVCSKVASGLRSSGASVGLFTSPHISSFRERIRIDNQLIDEAAILRGLRRIRSLMEEHDIPATYFEVVTLLSFTCFEEAAVDWAVIETGLGGRLDATNIVQPEATAITSIGFDHMEFLGDTLEAITREKGGILKDAVPALLGPSVNRDWLRTDISIEQITAFDSYDTENQELAAAILRTLGVSYQTDALAVRPPCRMERFGENVILDVAHNRAGIERVFEQLPPERCHLIFGVSRGRDPAALLDGYVQRLAGLYLAPVDHVRLLPVSELTAVWPQAQVADSMEDAIYQAKAVAKDSHHVLVAGSVFLMSAARAALGLKEAIDPMNLNEMFDSGKTRVLN